MKEIKGKTTGLYKHMEADAFVVKRSEKAKFNSGSNEHALEQTINLEAKSKGGVVGFTMRKSPWLK